MEKFSFTVGEEEANIPIKKIIKQKYNLSSRLMTKLKFQNLIKVNGTKVPGWVCCAPGDSVCVSLPEEKSDFPLEDIPINVVYEDSDLLIINKQPGVTVHPTKGHPSGTIANGLMTYMKNTNQSFKIRFVNRLDMDTTGLLIIAKNSHAQDSLSKIMGTDKIKKKYLAVVSGTIEKRQYTINFPIGRLKEETIRRGFLKEDKGGFPSITHVRLIKTFKNIASLAELTLETGRTHQIRVHMSETGHPLLGDYLYKGPCNLFNTRQALHAYSLTFPHPVTGEKLSVYAPLPEDMRSLIKVLDKAEI